MWETQSNSLTVAPSFAGDKLRPEGSACRLEAALYTRTDIVNES